jgi:hypothetical protein
MKFYRTSLRTSLAVVAAALFALSGCQREAAQERADQSAKTSTPKAEAAPAPEAHILVDEAQLRKPHAILGGTVENVGGERLEDLAVVLELRRRADGGVEQRTVPLKPAALAPGEKGRYSLKVLSDEWSGSRLLRLRSGSREQDVAFKSSPGARRPPERLPESRTITVTKGGRPRQNPGGEEFINTPDTPVSVP